MQLAVILKESNKVLNVISPPKVGDVYATHPDCMAEYCPDEVAIGWSFDPETKTFTAPEPQGEEE